MEKNLKDSYTSASGTLPVKVLLNTKLVRTIVEEKRIIPVHVQLNPTNECNLDCDWCSCSERDRSLFLSYEQIVDVMSYYKERGCESVTLTGGGEALLHPSIIDIVSRLSHFGIAIGIVSNGWNVENLCPEDWDKVTWARISLGDGRKEGSKTRYWERLAEVAQSKADLSFSYVLTNEPDLSLISKMVRL